MPTSTTKFPALIGSCFSIKDKLHTSPMKVELLTKFTKVCSTNDSSIRGNERKLSFNALSASSVFCKHIVHIIGMRSNKQVLRIYTKRIIASVANIKGFIKGSVEKLVRKAVGINSRSFAIGLKRNPSIRFFTVLFFANPNPTSIGFVNSRKKIFSNIFCGSAHFGILPPHKIIASNIFRGRYAY